MEKMIDKWLGVVADKLGLGVEHFWPILVRQQILEGLLSVMSVVIFGLLLILILKVGIPIWAKGDDTVEMEDIKAVIYGAFIFVVGVGLLVSTILFFAGGILQIINPEYYAIMEIGKTLNP